MQMNFNTIHKQKSLQFQCDGGLPAKVQECLVYIFDQMELQIWLCGVKCC
jgi:hypothetical protein